MLAACLCFLSTLLAFAAVPPSNDQCSGAEVIPGTGPFEPMPGRPMSGFTLLPSSIIDDDEAIRHWVGRAIEYGVTLPPKVPKAKKPKATTA